MARRLCIHEKFEAYTVKLRENEFEVEVDQDKLVRVAQQEADMVKERAENAQQPGSETSKRIEEIQKLLNP